jgi:hypothetical protein
MLYPTFSILSLTVPHSTYAKENRIHIYIYIFTYRTQHKNKHCFTKTWHFDYPKQRIERDVDEVGARMDCVTRKDNNNNLKVVFDHYALEIKMVDFYYIRSLSTNDYSRIERLVHN